MDPSMYECLFDNSSGMCLYSWVRSTCVFGVVSGGRGGGCKKDIISHVLLFVLWIGFVLFCLFVCFCLCRGTGWGVNE